MIMNNSYFALWRDVFIVHLHESQYDVCYLAVELKYLIHVNRPPVDYYTGFL
jgi:hypothetical protein